MPKRGVITVSIDNETERMLDQITGVKATAGGGGGNKSASMRKAIRLLHRNLGLELPVSSTVEYVDDNDVLEG